jgi:RNA polymerase sigma-70 factor (ECF subfamily)
VPGSSPRTTAADSPAGQPRPESAQDTGARAADLVSRIVEGDAAAEAELVERYSKGVRILLRRLTRDPTLVEDIHQETFLVVLRRIRANELRSASALAAFIRSTARNLLIADRRKESRTQPLGSDEIEALLESRAAESSRGAPQLDQVLASEEGLLVRNLLSELGTQRDREILLRFYLCEDSKEQVCRDLDVEPRLFNRVLYRARTRLRALWEQRAHQLGLEP